MAFSAFAVRMSSCSEGDELNDLFIQISITLVSILVVPPLKRLISYSLKPLKV